MKAVNKKNFPIHGYFIAPVEPVSFYRGIERYLFEPQILMECIDPSVSFSNADVAIWELYSSGWRREAYRLYEENMSPEWGDDYLLANVNIGRTILEIIEPHIGKHEILECFVYPPYETPRSNLTTTAEFLGYELAYPGGDYYSAVFNGLISDYRNEKLTKLYKNQLTPYGLFKTLEPLQNYLHDFREAVQTERDSNFCVYQIYLIE